MSKKNTSIYNCLLSRFFKTFGAETNLGSKRFREQENVPRLRGFRHYYVRPGGNNKSRKKACFIENIQNLCGTEGGNLISGISLFSFPSLNQRSKDKMGGSPAAHGAGNPSDGDPRVDHLCSNAVASLIRVINLL